MALSNWDTLAFDHEGKPSDGTFKNEIGNSVDIYKNWVYVHAPKMWVEGGASYINPIVARISYGDLQFAGFEIFASRGPQNSIFVVVMSHQSEGYGDENYKVEGGIGGSGYMGVDDICEKAGIALPEGDWGMVSSSTEDGGWEHHLLNWETGEQINHSIETEWIGIKKSTLDAFFAWTKTLDRERVSKWAVKCMGQEAMRFNQGNAFLVEHAGMDLEATAPEESAAPILEQMVKG
jgi:hypothetical protein